MSAKLGPKIIYTTKVAYDQMQSHGKKDIYFLEDIKHIIVDGKDYSMGTDVSNFVTNEELTNAISDFVTTSGLAEAVSDFVTSAQLTEAIAGFLTSSDIANLATKDEIADFITAEAIADLVSNDDLETALADIRSSVSSAFHFRGKRASQAELPNDPNEGDVYQIGNEEFAWNGSEWVALGDLIDLSGYKTGDEVTEEINAAIDEALASYDTSDIVTAKAQDAVDAAKNDIKAEAADAAMDDLYAALKAAGFKGTRSSMYSYLAAILNQKNNIVYADEADAVAAIAGSQLTDIVEALNAAQAGSNISFVADAAADGQTVIQLNGNNVDMAGYVLETNGSQITVNGQTTVENANVVDNSNPATPAQASIMFNVPAGAELTLKDSDIDTTGCSAINVVEGTVTMEGVDLNSSLAADKAATSFDSKPLIYANNSNVTIKDGKFIANTSSDDTCGLYGIYAANGGVITLGDQETGEGPTFITNSAPIGTNNTTGSIQKLTIYGGYYKSLMTSYNWQGAMYFGGGCDVEIFGGEFDGGDYDIALPYKPAKYIVAIHGGTFHGTECTIKKDYKNGGSGEDPDNTLDSIVIDGGRFAAELPAEYIAPGYKQTKIGDWWVVEAE